MDHLVMAYVIAACVGIWLIASIFSMSAHAAKHTRILALQLRMMAKIAKANGVPEEEVADLMKEIE